MKNIYKITKGQLISLWFFGIIGWFYVIDSYSDFAGFLSILTPAILVFYTMGWRNFNKKDNENKKVSLLVNLKNRLPSRKKIIISIIIIITITFTIWGIISGVENRQENLLKEKLKQEYNEAILNIDNLKTEFTACLNPTIEKKYQEELRSCNLYRNKVKHDYNFCVSLTYINSPASCLYENDYEKIDCSEETIEKKAKLESLKNVPDLCLDSFNKVKDANSIIEEYSKKTS